MLEVVNAWQLHATSINLVCQIVTNVDLPEYDFSTNNELEKIDSITPWRRARINHANYDFELHMYRKRVIVTWHPEDLHRKDLKRIDSFIRFYLEDLEEIMLACLRKCVILNEGDSWRTMPLLLADLDIKRPIQEPWISDGVTSFYFKVFDASKGMGGFIRISRHLILCANVGPRLTQEIVNLIYEKFLYDTNIDKDNVFSFLDGLAPYTLPNELNTHFQEAFSQISFLLAIAAILLATIQIFSSEMDYIWRFVLMVASIIGIGGAWYISRHFFRAHND